MTQEPAITFTREQVDWIHHHVRNKVMAIGGWTRRVFDPDYRKAMEAQSRIITACSDIEKILNKIEVTDET